MSLSKIDALVKEVKQTNKIDMKKWKEFKIGGKDGLFECNTAKQILKVDGGYFQYITRSGFNNGLTRLVKKVDNKINEENCLTIGAEGFFAFYQEKPFMAGNKIYVLRHKRLNKYNGLFICSVLNSIVEKYSYNNARILERIKDEVHRLPTNKKGEPDWKYMEWYIKKRSKKMERGLSKIDASVKEVKQTKKINTENWKEFRLIDIFPDYNHGQRLTKADRIPGDVPLITAGQYDNGIAHYVKQNKNNKIFKDCVTLDMFGNCFYQEGKFICDDNVYPLKNKRNKFVGLFLTSILNKYINFDFKKQFRLKHLINVKIRLPTNKKGEPDWQFMEDYIKSLKYSMGI